MARIKPERKLHGLTYVLAHPPEAVYLRYMGRYTPAQPNEHGKPLVTHLRGLGCVVKGGLEEFAIKERIIQTICAIEDPAILEVLRAALFRE